jgi:PAS domain S-box-containing protein
MPLRDDAQDAEPSLGTEPIQDHARAFLAAVVDSSDDAIITKTLDGTITSWNASAVRLLGYTAAEIIGQPITVLIPLERREEERYITQNLCEGRRIEHYETVRVTKDGRSIDVSLTISPVRDQTGQIVGASKILRDITERKRIEREFQEVLAERDQILESERAARSQAERLSTAKDEFLAMLSHELRTPLNAILGWTEILRRGSSTHADFEKGLVVIERNVRAQTQLVDDLLDMSRIISGQMRFDVRSVMPSVFVQGAIEAVRPAADAGGVRLEATLDPAIGPVSGDAYRLQQVVWNLISNAIKFTPRGGHVQVTLERVNSNIEICVADSGIGIQPDFLPHIFERFRQADPTPTRKHGGLGLGLSIVKHIVELHGGTVAVKSDGEGKGATFRVQLPVAISLWNPNGRGQHPRSSQPLAVPWVNADLSNLVVLVVDDDPDSRDLVHRLLSDCGATVTPAASAAEALAATRNQRPDILISDIGMPEVDGYELLRSLRTTSEIHCPAIALTAFARSEDRTRSLLAGYVAHVSKPVEAAELIATVAAVSGRVV